MNKKTKTNNLIQLGIWIIGIVCLLIIILIKKSAELLDILMYPFLLLYLIMPIGLYIFHYETYRQESIHKVDRYMIMPFAGSSIFALLSYINLFTAVNEEGQKYIIQTTLALVILNLLFAIYIQLNPQYKFKHHSIALFLSIIFYIIYLIIGVNISYNYSIRY